MTKTFALCIVLTTIIAGCSLFRYSGYKQPNLAPKVRTETKKEATQSSSKPRQSPQDYLPEQHSNDEDTLFYSDLGLDRVDISQYPTQQQYNYKIYSNVCSRCHTLARSINAPVVNRNYWEFYLLGMRSRNWFIKNPAITKEEQKAIIDFLEYDSNVRKLEHKREFEELTNELKRRFTAVLDERVRKLQEGEQPQLLPPTTPK